MASVEERVKQIIVEQLGVDEGEVTPTASFVDDLGADSLDTVMPRKSPRSKTPSRTSRNTRKQKSRPPAVGSHTGEIQP